MSTKIIRADDPLRVLTVRRFFTEPEPVPTADAGEEQMRAAQKTAFEKGYAEGKRATKDQVESKLEPVVQRYERSIAEMTAAHAAVVDNLNAGVVELAMAVARKIIQRELALDPDLVSALATAALRRVQSHQAITLRLNSEDYKRICATSAFSSSAVTAVSDASLHRGDFIIDTSQTHIDGRIDQQLDALSRVMAEA